MRTVSQMSQFVGIPKRTLQYWSEEQRRDAQGRSIGGVGILRCVVDPKNGYRQFDDDSIIDVLIIQAGGARRRHGHHQSTRGFAGRHPRRSMAGHIYRRTFR